MSRFFIGIGGTGQHLLLAYVDLIALAFGCLEDDSSHPVRTALIDADRGSDGGSAYELYGQQVNRLRSLVSDNQNPYLLLNTGDSGSFAPYPQDRTGQFADVVAAPGRHLLFSQQQLRVQFANGFYGQPAVGCSVFKWILEEQDRENALGPLEPLLGSQANTAERVGLAGSLCGGTGAGCLPAMVERIREKHPNIKMQALTLLPWFRLEPEDDSDRGAAALRNAEMSASSNGGLLYAAEYMARNSSTVFAGHPFLNSAPARRSQGDTCQSAHLDLGVPYYGAITLANFLHGEARDQCNSFRIACAVDRTETPTLAAPGFWPAIGGPIPDNDALHPARVENLVQRNAQLIARVEWLRRYCDRPPDTTWSLRPQALRSAFGDKLAQQEKWPEISRQLANLTTTKGFALARFCRSFPSVATRIGASQLAPGSPVTEQSVNALLQELCRIFGLGRPSDLDAWIGAGQGSSDLDTSTCLSLVRGIARGIRLNGEGPSRDQTNVFLLPDRPRDDQVAPSGHIPGALDNLDHNALANQLEPRLIAPRHLPTEDGVRTFIDLHILQDRLTGWTLTEQQGANGRAESGPSAEWSGAWLTLLRGLAKGSYRLDLEPIPPSPGSIEPLSTPLGVIRGEVAGPEPGQRLQGVIGRLDPDLLVVPAVQCRHDDRHAEIDWDRTTFDGEADIDRRLSWWADLLREIATFEGREPPKWVEFLRSFFSRRDLSEVTQPQKLGLCNSDNPLAKLLATWGGRTVELCFPLDALELAGQEDQLMPFLRDGMGLNVQNLNLSDRDTQRALGIQETDFVFFWPIENDRVPERQSAGYWQDGNASPEDRQRQEDILKRLRFGVHFDHANSRVRRLNQNVEVLSQDIVQQREAVSLLGREEQSLVPGLPVKLRYLDLVENLDALQNNQNIGAVTTVPVRGRSLPLSVATMRAADHTNNPIEIEADVLLWPDFRAAGWNSYYALLRASNPENESVKKHEAVFVLKDQQPDGGSSPYRVVRASWNNSLQSLSHKTENRQGDSFSPPQFVRRREEQAGVKGAPIAFVLRNRETLREGGMVVLGQRYRNIDRSGQESWGVDFGTSSTVVAACSTDATARVNDGEPWVCQPQTSLDCTMEICLHSAKVNPSRPIWFPVWSGYNPTLETSFSTWPSMLICMDDKVQGIPIEDWRFGQEYNLFNEHAELEHAKTDLKWPKAGEDPQNFEQGRLARRHFLIHLLEIALAMRTKYDGSSRGNIRSGDAVPRGATEVSGCRLPHHALPEKAFFCFSLPLRLAEFRDQFQSEIFGLLEEIKRRTGVQLGPDLTNGYPFGLSWESSAGKPMDHNAEPRRIYVSADLGGGSLDLWGKIQGGNGKPEMEFADSIQIGGHSLLQAVHGTAAPAQRMQRDTMRQLLRGVPINKELRGPTLEKFKQQSDGFFIACYEVVARWISALARRGHSAYRDNLHDQIEIAFLGRGWELAPRPESAAVDPWIAFLNRRVPGLANLPEVGNTAKTDQTTPRTFTILDRKMDDPTGQTVGFAARKTYLARYMARYGATADETEQNIGEIRNRKFLLMDLYAPRNEPSETVPFERGMDHEFEGRSYTWNQSSERNTISPPFEPDTFDFSQEWIGDKLRRFVVSPADGTITSDLAPFSCLIEGLRGDYKIGKKGT